MKNLTYATVIIVTAIILLFPGSVKAADMSVGAATWYAWWEDNGDNEYDPALLYGPVSTPIRICRFSPI